MRQAGYLQEVAELFRFGVQQHLDGKSGTHFRNAQASCLAIDFLRCYTQDRSIGTHLNDLWIRSGNIMNPDSGKVLQMLIHGRNHMSQFVQLQDGIMERVEIEVGGQNIRFHIICRMLYRREVIHIVITGHNHHAAGMLTSGTLDSSAANRKAVDFSRAVYQSPFFQILLYIAIGSLIGYRGNGAGLKHVVPAEQLFCITMGRGLVFPGEVQVDIRCLVSVKSQEGFKRDVMAVPVHLCTAFRTVLRRQVEAGANAAVCDKFTMLAIRADIVGGQRIDF